jgi:hypothetical protein
MIKELLPLMHKEINNNQYDYRNTQQPSNEILAHTHSPESNNRLIFMFVARIASKKI